MKTSNMKTPTHLSRRRFLSAGTAALVVPVLISGRTFAADSAPLTGDSAAGTEPLDQLLSEFVTKHEVPGASLAVGRSGELLYSRGCGFAERETATPVEPESLFRIASISKPITAVAIMQLVTQKRLKLNDSIHDLLQLAEPKDERWHQVTVRHALEHVGGWDREVSFDPMFRSQKISESLSCPLPVGPPEIIRYMLQQPLDHDPGAKYAYSNFGYSLLGRVIERIAGTDYETYVRNEIFKPLGIIEPRIGHTAKSAKRPHEVVYYSNTDETFRAVAGDIGKSVQRPYGGWDHEAFDAHGGWIASAADLVHFAMAVDTRKDTPILKARAAARLFVPPARLGGDQDSSKLPDVYYGKGWNVRRLKSGINTWHNGEIDGTSTILVRRHDGFCWAVLFNARSSKASDSAGKSLAPLIDSLVHRAVDACRWA